MLDQLHDMGAIRDNDHIMMNAPLIASGALVASTFLVNRERVEEVLRAGMRSKSH